MWWFLNMQFFFFVFLLISLCDCFCFVMSFLMTTNRTVNAIILVQRGLRFCWKNECEFLQCPPLPPPPTPPFCIDCTFLLLRFKDGSKQLCVKSSDNKLGLPSCRGSSLVQWASLVPHRWSSSSRWLLSTLLAFFFFCLAHVSIRQVGCFDHTEALETGNRLVNCEEGVVSTQALILK